MPSLYQELESNKTTNNPREKAGFFSILFFRWLNGVIELGNKSTLTIESFYPLSPEDDPEILTDKLEEAWNRELYRQHSEHALCVAAGTEKLTRPRLWRALLGFLSKSECAKVLLLAGLRSICLLLLPVFLYFLLLDVTDEQGGRLGTCIWASCICVCAGIVALSVSHYQFRAALLGMKVRTALTGLLYKKVLRTPASHYVNGSGGPGNVLNLVSNDVHRFHVAFLYLPNAILSPVEVITGFCLLYWFAGWPTLIGLCVTCVAVLIQSSCGTFISKLRQEAASVSDRRVAHTREIISGIRAVKMCSWESYCKEIIEAIRRKEMKILKKLNLFVGGIVVAPFIGRIMLPFVMLLSLAMSGTVLTPAILFFVLAVTGILRVGIFFYLGLATQQFAECRTSLLRIEEYISKEEHSAKTIDSRSFIHKNAIIKQDSNNFTKMDLYGKDNIFYANKENRVYIDLQNITCAYNGTRSIISNVTLHLTGENLITVFGPVGSGKSSLLLAMLEEIPFISGKLQKSGSISYVPQIPWMFCGTIQENIVFSLPFDKSRYKNIIMACELETDIASFPEGDLTMVGEHGVVLSGGQRTRVCLARALYADSDIYLLDDPLSAVDAKVGRRLFDNCINGALKGRMRILVTHHQQFLHYASHVILMDDGQILEQGTFSEVTTSKGVHRILEPIKKLTNSIETNSEDEKTKETPEQEYCQGKEVKNSLNDDVGLAIDKEERTSGSVSLKTYWSYLGASLPAPFLVALIAFVVLAYVSLTIPDWWLSSWTKISWSREQDRVKVYIYIGIVTGSITLIYVSALLVLQTVIISTSCLYNQMVNALLKSPVLFFDINPTGRIVNRFSKDLGLMDEILPSSLYIASRALIVVLISFLIPFFSNYWLGFATFPLIFVCGYYGRWYIKTSREVARLQAISYSPVLSHFSSTLEGLVTIRTFQTQEDWIKKYFRCQYNLGKCWFITLSLQQWLGIRMDLPVFVFILAVTWTSLLCSIRPGLIGLSIVYAVQMFNVLEFTVTKATEVENTMTSVERMMEYARLDSEPGYSQQTQPPWDWPQEGNIKFDDVSQVYYEGGPTVLKNITFEVRAKEKIGIVGRTGAGKTSLVAALMRMPEPRGCITVDGMNANKMNLQVWRKSVSVIPQNPVLFSGTLRRNIDPTERFTDAEIWQVLQDAHLRAAIERLESELYHELVEGGKNFSVGERQLICLARALLQGNKIIVMDEATANVDFKTDRMIQETIRDTFKNCTVLTIAHRVNTIMDYDRVLVLHEGRVMEIDEPAVLLANEDGLFTQLTKQSQLKTE